MRRMWLSISCVVIASAVLMARQTPSPQMPPGITRTQLIDNPTVLVAKLKMDPGARETLHTHPFSAVVIQLTPGRIEITYGDKPSTVQREAGHVDFIAREMPHAAANVGSAPFEVVTIAIKPDRTRPASAPASPATAGILRTTVLDNDEARVTRVTFVPGAREGDHRHPFDLVLVALTGGRTEIAIGGQREIEDRPPGFVWFLPRDVTHMAANASARHTEFISIGVK